MGEFPEGGGGSQQEQVERRSCRGQSLPGGPVQDLRNLACSWVSLGPHTALRLFFFFEMYCQYFTLLQVAAYLCSVSMCVGIGKYHWKLFFFTDKLLTPLKTYGTQLSDQWQ